MDVAVVFLADDHRAEDERRAAGWLVVEHRDFLDLAFPLKLAVSCVDSVHVAGERRACVRAVVDPVDVGVGFVPKRPSDHDDVAVFVAEDLVLADTRFGIDVRAELQFALGERQDAQHAALFKDGDGFGIDDRRAGVDRKLFVPGDVARRKIDQLERLFGVDCFASEELRPLDGDSLALGWNFEIGDFAAVNRAVSDDFVILFRKDTDHTFRRRDFAAGADVVANPDDLAGAAIESKELGPADQADKVAAGQGDVAERPVLGVHRDHPKRPLGWRIWR